MPHVSLRLLCQSTDLVLSTSMPLLDRRASREIITTTLSNIPTLWPPQGQLIVEFNSDKGWGRTWLPLDIVSHCLVVFSSILILIIRLQHPDRPLEVTNHVREGINNIRLTQLDDLSAYTFTLFASPAEFPDTDFSDLDTCIASFNESQNVVDSGIFAMEATVRVFF